MASNKKDYVSKYKGEKIDELLEGVETLQGEGEGSVSKIINDTVAEKIAEVVNDAPENFDTLKEMSDWIAGHENSASTMNTNIATNAQNITNLQSEAQRIENKFDNKYISKIVTSLPVQDIEVGVIYMVLKEGIDPSDVQSPLVPQMSSNTSDICDVSVDSIYSGDAWNIFDRDSTTGWMGQGQAGRWVKIDFHGSPQVVTKIELTPDYVNGVVRIKDFTLAGSNDNFVTSKTIYSGTHGNNTSMETFTFDNTEAFSYYKLTLTSYWEFGGLGIKEMQLYGAGSDDLGDNLFDKWVNFNGSSTGWERFNENGAASGHIITNSLNEEQTEREKLKFSDDFNITDNEANNSTEISERLLTNQEIDDILDNIPINSGSSSNSSSSEFDNANIYSEEEKIIGRWTDGNLIYQKTTDSISRIQDIDMLINKTEHKSSGNGMVKVSISKPSNSQVVNVTVTNNGSTIYTHAFSCDIYGVYSAVTIEDAFTISNMSYNIKSWGTNSRAVQSTVEIYIGDTLVGSGYSSTTNGDNTSYPSSGSFNIDVRARVTYQYTKTTDT